MTIPCSNMHMTCSNMHMTCSDRNMVTLGLYMHDSARILILTAATMRARVFNKAPRGVHVYPAKYTFAPKTMARHVPPRRRSRRSLYTTIVRSVLGAGCSAHNRHNIGARVASVIIVLCSLGAHSSIPRGVHFCVTPMFEHAHNNIMFYTYVRTCA